MIKKLTTMFQKDTYYDMHKHHFTTHTHTSLQTHTRHPESYTITQNILDT